MKINTTASVRVSRQCVISLEVVGPKALLNRKCRMGNWLIFQYRMFSVDSYGSLSDRGSVTVVTSNCYRTGECRNDENQPEAGMAPSTRGSLESRRP